MFNTAAASMLGAVVSLKKIVCVAVEVLPQLSVAVNVRVTM
jgi:hypothetical protein